MAPEVLALIVLIFAVAAEALHNLRVKRVALLAFGPSRKASILGVIGPFLRAVSLAGIAWGALVLLQNEPKTHSADSIDEKRKKHVILALDVSPSMRLVDAGLDKKQSRMKRASEVMRSFFTRVPTSHYKISVICFYTEAKPVVIDTSDMGVVQNILGDLPMHYAFKKGETDLFAGLREASNTARLWDPRSTTLLIISDGDTVPAKGMPRMPASVADTLVIGVGDPTVGSFIAGRQSRQDVSTLRQVAIRLGGTYHNANDKHIPTEMLGKLTVSASTGQLPSLSKREIALIAIALGATIYAMLPMLLFYFGSAWKPGVRKKSRSNPVTSAI